MCCCVDRVWLVVCGYDYEGDNVVGAFLSEKDALAIKAKWDKANRYDKMYEYCYVRPVEVGMMDSEIFC